MYNMLISDWNLMVAKYNVFSDWFSDRIKYFTSYQKTGGRKNMYGVVVSDQTFSVAKYSVFSG